MLRINRERYLRRFETLAGLTTEPPYTRRAFTEIYKLARAWLNKEMKTAGLKVQLDAGANLIGRREGKRPEAIVLGSHIDTVVGGGRFDGIAGVLAALEVAQTLFENEQELAFALEVVDFLSEEPSDYGASCVGSRAWAGTLSQDMLQQTNQAGETLEAAIKRMGGEPSNVPLRKVQDLVAYLELHIEQGPTLEKQKIPIGIVTGIAGIRRWEVTFEGKADHAGTTPMNIRKDALVKASRFIASVSDVANYWEVPIVATVGKLEIFPNAANVVPGKVVLTLEARSLESRELDLFSLHLKNQHRQAVFNEISHSEPVLCNAVLQNVISEAARTRHLTTAQLMSGAGHDAMHVARLCPVAMLFIPCQEGRSHSPDEFVREDDLVAGAEVLLETVLRLNNYKKTNATE
jgi:beta-ureidopropionase / N-carbamoyl-L-amino-acid hydrolase